MAKEGKHVTPAKTRRSGTPHIARAEGAAPVPTRDSNGLAVSSSAELMLGHGSSAGESSRAVCAFTGHLYIALPRWRSLLTLLAVVGVLLVVGTTGFALPSLSALARQGDEGRSLSHPCPERQRSTRCAHRTTAACSGGRPTSEVAASKRALAKCQSR